MGPEAIMDAHSGYNLKTPPFWDGITKPYRLYAQELENWLDFSSLQKKERGPAVIARLTGEPQRLALNIDRAVRVSEKGAEKIIEKLEEVYGSTEEQDIYHHYKELRSFRRSTQKSVSEFLGGFHSRADKLQSNKDVKLPEKLLSMMLIDHACLTGEQEAALFGACGGDLSSVKVTRALKLVMEQSVAPTQTAYASSGYAENSKVKKSSFCRYCHKKGHVLQECFKKKRADERKSQNTYQKNWNFLEADDTFKMLSPIIDTAATETLIGENTLTEYLAHLGLSQPMKLSPIALIHKFGLKGVPEHTKYSAYIRLPIRGKIILVRADVLPGDHPFLIGLSTQEKMKASIDTSNRKMTIRLDDIPFTILLERKGKYLTLPICELSQSFYASSDNDQLDLKKLHENSGHSSLQNLRTLLEHAGRWKKDYSDALKSIIFDCDVCKTTGSPQAAPVADIDHIDPIFNNEVEIDVVYFDGRPFLHAECKKTKLSAISQLHSRQSSDLWNAFLTTWLFVYGPPSKLQADPEFDISMIRQKTKDWGIALEIVAAKAHWQQGIVERGNGVVKAIFERVSKGHENVPLSMRVSHAVFVKNTLFGSKKASSYELVYNIPVSVSGSASMLPHNLRKSYIKAAASRKISCIMNARARSLTPFCLGEYVYFYRAGQGFVGPAKISRIPEKGNIIHVRYAGREFTRPRNQIRKTHQPLEYYLELLSQEEDSSSNASPRSPSVDPSSSASRSNDSPTPLTLRLFNYRPGDPTPETILGSTDNPPLPLVESTIQEDAGPIPLSSDPPAANTRSKSRAPKGADASHITFTASSYFYRSDGRATPDEYASAFSKERKSWVDQKVFTSVSAAEVPSGSNLIGSHVIYRWKDIETEKPFLKARIVPHGNRDNQKDILRTDCPTLRPETLRIVCSYAVDLKLRLKAIDIETAFLQTGEIKREIYIQPPSEEESSGRLWKLLKTAYGLVDGPIVWYLHSRKVLLRYGLTASKLDPTLYFMENGSLIIATQMDDFIYAGTENEIENFELYLKKHYKVGSIKAYNFSFSGVCISQRKDYTVLISQPSARTMEGVMYSDPKRSPDSTPTVLEKRSFMSVNGSLLWYGSQTIPHLMFISSSFAAKVPDLRIRHLKALQSTLKFTRTFNSAILLNPSELTRSKLLVFTDASHASDGQVHSREGIIIFKASISVENQIVHPLLWTSRKIKRIAKSTLSAETMAAVDGFEDAVYIQRLLQEVHGIELPIELVVDSKSLFDLLSTTHRVSDKRLHIDVALLREAYQTGSLKTITWTPRKTQLANGLTKANRLAGKELQRILNTGILALHSTENLSKCKRSANDSRV